MLFLCHFLNNFHSLICQKCKKEKKEGYKCKDCEFRLCNNCYDYIICNKKNKHLHKMFLSMRDNWYCNECKKRNQGKIAFFCQDCNKDYCLDCILE